MSQCAVVGDTAGRENHAASTVETRFAKEQRNACGGALPSYFFLEDLESFRKTFTATSPYVGWPCAA